LIEGKNKSTVADRDFSSTSTDFIGYAGRAQAGRVAGSGRLKDFQGIKKGFLGD
jgi:hypothetical protein